MTRPDIDLAGVPDPAIRKVTFCECGPSTPARLVAAEAYCNACDRQVRPGPQLYGWGRYRAELEAEAESERWTRDPQ